MSGPSDSGTIETGTSKLLAAYELAMRVGFPFLLGVSGTMGSIVLDHDRRLTQIESSRYTIQDARTDRDRAEAERREFDRILTRLDQRTKGIEDQLSELVKIARERQR